MEKLANGKSDQPQYNQIILLGDSITQQECWENNWAWKLACVYVRKADILNRGFSGKRRNELGA